MRGFGRAQNFLAARLLSQKKIPNDKSGLNIFILSDLISNTVTELRKKKTGAISNSCIC